MLADVLKNNSKKAVNSFVKQHSHYERFDKNCTVSVYRNGQNTVYKNVSVSIFRHVSYEDYKVEIIWEEDTKQINFRKLGLHGKYSSNWNLFEYNEITHSLEFDDDDNEITINA